jgi:hypothetical protein
MYKRRPDLKSAPMPGFDKPLPISIRPQPTDRAAWPPFSDLEVNTTAEKVTGPIPCVLFISPNYAGATTGGDSDESKPHQRASRRQVRRRY